MICQNARNLTTPTLGLLLALIVGITSACSPKSETGKVSESTESAEVATLDTPVDPYVLTVYKDAFCGCCTLWVDHMREAGFDVKSIDVPDLNAVKDRHGIPHNMESCHTALIDDYVIEGHVPAEAVSKLLADRPEIRGIAVPAMPIGSPGMEVPGREPQIYDVLVLDSTQRKVYMSFKGVEALTKRD